jgi:D-alanine--poly(phosphoribitol) ligase subunit 1
MKALNANTFQSIRIIAFGGEGYPKSELVKLYNLYKKRIKFFNVYGPTECTCICSAYPIQENDFNELIGLPPLGELNQNFNYLIIDENGQENSEGELYLLGPNVGAGYYNNQEKTREVFIECDHGRFYLKKMYKTGDIVKEIKGVLYFVGRKDNQIKHLGYRIELEEIEAALNIIEGINQSAVIYQRVNPSFGKIIAFIATKKDIDQNYIGDELKKVLPSYMLPNKIKILTALPKNPNGKVDKKILVDSIE